MFNDILDRPKMVFLGGTCNDTAWRDEITPKLKITVFNPIVKNWTPDCQEIEKQKRLEADFALYVISPKMTGVYSIAEIVDDSNKRPDKTIFCFLKKDGNSSFDKGQIKSLESVGAMVSANGGKWVKSLDEVVTYINNASLRR